MLARNPSGEAPLLRIIGRSPIPSHQALVSARRAQEAAPAPRSNGDCVTYATAAPLFAALPERGPASDEQGAHRRKMDDEEEACTPRADEATPLQDQAAAPPLRARRLRHAGPGAPPRRAAAQQARCLDGATWGNDYQCREGGWIELEVHYYHLLTRIRCGVRDARLGATDQLTGGDEGADDDTTNLEDPSTYWDCNGKVHIRKLAFGAVKPMELHFPYIHDITPTGPLDVKYWDDYQKALNDESFATE